MHCPDCSSTNISKNGKKKGKQNHICPDCQRQFIDIYDAPRGYSDEFKRECLEMYVNGMKFRGIERVKQVHHTKLSSLGQTSGTPLARCPRNQRNSRSRST